MATRLAHDRGGRTQALSQKVILGQRIGHLNELRKFNVTALKATCRRSWRKFSVCGVIGGLNFIWLFRGFLRDVVIHVWQLSFLLSN